MQTIDLDVVDGAFFLKPDACIRSVSTLPPSVIRFWGTRSIPEKVKSIRRWSLENARKPIELDSVSLRVALHAAALTFPHPVSRSQLRVEAPLPEDMESLISDKLMAQ